MKKTRKFYKYVAAMISMLMVFTSVSSESLFAQEDASSYKLGDRLNTVSSKADHITLNLFDYKTGKTESVDGNNENGINKNHALKFRKENGDNADLINQYTNSGNPRLDIVKRELNKMRFPVLNKNNESLDYLFDLNTLKGDRESKKIYSDMDYLFTKDENGYYNFDSNASYAEADTDNKRFNVYQSDYKLFYPFDEYSEIKWSDIKTNDKQLNYIESDKANHYFGMTMSATFYQPRNGQINGEDMVFEFSGDDDVWVFIDGKLVLDLGGIHDTSSGSINFKTGEVKVNGKKVNDKSLDLSKFDDYSHHTIDFFYLERGNYASNCKLKFNLPTIPKNSIMVTKEVEDEIGNSLNFGQNIDFEFNIKKDGKNLVNTAYTIRENDAQIGTGITDKNGNFTLKHNQSAVFEDFLVTDKYTVTELGAALDGYEVKVNDTEVDIIDADGEFAGKIKAASSGELVAGQYPNTLFRNIVMDTATLNITKNLESTDTVTDKMFSMQLKINGELYTGTYDIGQKKGISAKDGIIKIKANEIASISGLPYGASFEVEEILDGSYIPSYNVAGEAYEIIHGSYDDTDYAFGKIKGDSTVTITNKKVVTDDESTKVTVKKTWSNSDKYDLPDYINVTLYEDVDKDNKVSTSDKLIGEVQLKPANSWSYTWRKLAGDKNYVVDEELPDGYEQKSIVKTYGVTSVTKVSDQIDVKQSLKYNIGTNNLIVGKISDSKYQIWTDTDLNLNTTEKNNLIKKVDDLLNYRLTSRNTSVISGSAIDFTPTQTGGTLSFAKSNWKSFWVMKYERADNITITNELDIDKKTSLTVNKEWVGDTAQTRPDSITVRLVKNGNDTNQTKVIKADANGNWSHTFNNLEYYSLVNGKYIVNEYSVKEIKIGSSTVVNGAANGYVSSIGATQNNVVTITNTQQLGSLRIVKTIDKADFINGDPIFTFKITDSHNNVLYRTIRFQTGDKFTKDVVIENLPLGDATVEELDTIRYTCTTEKTQVVEVKFTPIVEVSFKNQLTNDDDFSHTDVVENFFTVNSDGTVEIEKRLTKDAVVVNGNDISTLDINQIIPNVLLKHNMILSDVLKGDE